jgi:hypothetical protein
MTTAEERLNALRERMKTMGHAPRREGPRRLDDDDLARLAELPITPPEEKDRALQALWDRLHGR